MKINGFWSFWCAFMVATCVKHIMMANSTAAGISAGLATFSFFRAIEKKDC